MKNYENNILEEEREKKKGGMVKLLVGACFLGMVAGTAFEGTQYTIDYLKNKNSDIEQQASAEESGIVAEKTSDTKTGNAVSEVVENVMPSIVAIDITTTEQVNTFWGQNYEEESSGSGSGIIIGENNEELLIVTNNHVVEGENADIQVTFTDESVATAVLKGADTTSDLAVIAVVKADLTEVVMSNIKIATLGDSDNVRVGDAAIAIGNALGYGQSVTVGYISAKDREVSQEDSSMTLLQTDAAINPGNSGGALLNEVGEVIGINSMKYASEEVEGMGYAIPISTAIPIINDLMNREQLDVSEQGYLGIMGDEVTEETAALYHMPEGVYVGEVTKDSPAEKGGIVAGNIIVKINEKNITTMKVLQEVLTYTKAGTVVNITVMELENGEYVEKTLEVTLGSKISASNE